MSDPCPHCGAETEQGQRFFSQARTKLSELVAGKTVTLVRDVSERDRYDRLLAYIFAEDVFANFEMVSAGYASSMTYPPDVACADLFAQAQRGASTSELGLWAPIPTPRPTSSGGGGGGNCDPSYPTVCIPPPPPDLDCGQIPYRRFAVVGDDPHGFDGDDDGIGCER